MLEEIKKIAQGVIDNQRFLGVCKGTVVQIEPLTIAMEGVGIEVRAPMVIISRYLKGILLLEEIEEGDEVLMLSPVCGNKYYLMDVMK